MPAKKCHQDPSELRPVRRISLPRHVQLPIGPLINAKKQGAIEVLLELPSCP
jgi:hypothetical protein